jgi:DNA-binding NarL/FixJ family response regulator
MRSNSSEKVIWVVEDNDLYRKNLEALINDAGGMCCEHAFVNCEDALKTLEEYPPPDVVLMDIGLPGMNGIDGTREFKGRSQTTLIVMLTVNQEEHAIFQAICAGASGYLLKAAPSDRIVEAINDVLSGGAPITPQIARKVLEAFAKVNAPKADYGLTEREREILQLLVEGLSKQRIAEKIFLSYHTIDFHLRNIYNKLHVHNKAGAVAKTLKERII